MLLAAGIEPHMMVCRQPKMSPVAICQATARDITSAYLANELRMLADRPRCLAHTLKMSPAELVESAAHNVASLPSAQAYDVTVTLF